MTSFISNQYLKNITLEELDIYCATSVDTEAAVPILLTNKEEKVIDIVFFHDDEKHSYTSNEESLQENFHLKFDKPGVYRKVKIRLESTFPLMLFQTWRYFHLKTEIIVHPIAKRMEVITENDKRGPVHDIEFRRFVPGDKLNKVDWKIYAKKSELIVKDDLNMDSSFNILDEKTIKKYGEDGLGSLCAAIRYHIEQNRSFIFKSLNGKEAHYSKKNKMYQLMGNLIEEFYS